MLVSRKGHLCWSVVTTNKIIKIINEFLYAHITAALHEEYRDKGVAYGPHQTNKHQLVWCIL